MGWWESGTGEAIGDGPVDAFIDLLRQLTPPPTVKLLLDAIHAAIADVGAVTLIDSPSSPLFRLRVQFAAPLRDVVSGDPSDKHLVDAVCEFLFEVQEEYHFVFKRKPYLKEVLRTILFCLRGEALPYVDSSDLPETWELTNISMEPSKPAPMTRQT